jgi:hypothetical protein
MKSILSLISKLDRLDLVNYGINLYGIEKKEHSIYEILDHLFRGFSVVQFSDTKITKKSSSKINSEDYSQPILIKALTSKIKPDYVSLDLLPICAGFAGRTELEYQRIFGTISVLNENRFGLKIEGTNESTEIEFSNSDKKIILPKNLHYKDIPKALFSEIEKNYNFVRRELNPPSNSPGSLKFSSAQEFYTPNKKTFKISLPHREKDLSQREIIIHTRKLKEENKDILIKYSRENNPQVEYDLMNHLLTVFPSIYQTYHLNNILEKMADTKK